MSFPTKTTVCGCRVGALPAGCSSSSSSSRCRTSSNSSSSSSSSGIIIRARCSRLNVPRQQAPQGYMNNRQQQEQQRPRGVLRVVSSADHQPPVSLSSSSPPGASAAGGAPGTLHDGFREEEVGGRHPAAAAAAAAAAATMSLSAQGSSIEGSSVEGLLVESSFSNRLSLNCFSPHRRHVVGLLVCSPAAVAAAAAASLALGFCGEAHAAPAWVDGRPGGTLADGQRMKENFGVILMISAEEAISSMGRSIGADYQRDFFKLRQQEFAPLKKANFGGLAAVGQMLNVNDIPYFNFLSYIQWKLIAKMFPSQADRKEVNIRVGRSLLDRTAPHAVTLALAHPPPPPPPPTSQTLNARSLMTAGSGAFGGPTEWDEQEWMGGGTGFSGSKLAPGGGEASGNVPASVVRSSAGLLVGVEEILQKLLALNFLEGYSVEWTAAESEVAAAAAAAASAAASGSQAGVERRGALKVKVQKPANLAGAVLLRAENNFCQHYSSSMISAFFERVGVEAQVDEFFYNQKLEYKPKSLLEQAVLSLGDPLVPLVNPFDVDEIIETWDVQLPV